MQAVEVVERVEVVVELDANAIVDSGEVMVMGALGETSAAGREGGGGASTETGAMSGLTVAERAGASDASEWRESETEISGAEVDSFRIGHAGTPGREGEAIGVT